MLVLVECLLCILFCDDIAGDDGSFDGIVFVHMFEEHCLADWRFVVDAFAAVSVAASADLVEEGTVHLVHLGSVHLG